MTELNWDWVEVEIKRIVGQAEAPFDPDTVANARELLEACRRNAPLPSSVAKGYWSTISLSWPGFEIEVFEDRLEVYHFHEGKSFGIWYEAHRPLDDFSQKFLDELSALKEKSARKA